MQKPGKDSHGSKGGLSAEVGIDDDVLSGIVGGAGTPSAAAMKPAIFEDNLSTLAQLPVDDPAHARGPVHTTPEGPGGLLPLHLLEPTTTGTTSHEQERHHHTRHVPQSPETILPLILLTPGSGIGIGGQALEFPVNKP